MTIKETLQQFDKLDKKRLDEHSVSSALRQLKSEDGQLMAFDFVENYSHKETGWGTYYGPMMTWRSGDGTFTESPHLRIK